MVVYLSNDEELIVRYPHGTKFEFTKEPDWTIERNDPLLQFRGKVVKVTHG